MKALVLRDPQLHNPDLYFYSDVNEEAGSPSRLKRQGMAWSLQQYLAYFGLETVEAES